MGCQENDKKRYDVYRYVIMPIVMCCYIVYNVSFVFIRFQGLISGLATRKKTS